MKRVTRLDSARMSHVRQSSARTPIATLMPMRMADCKIVHGRKKRAHSGKATVRVYSPRPRRVTNHSCMARAAPSALRLLLGQPEKKA